MSDCRLVRHCVFCLRLSSPRDLSHQAVEAEEEEEAELHLLKRNHGTTTDIPSTPAVVIKSDEAGLSPR